MLWLVLMASAFAWDRNIGVVYSVEEKVCLAIPDDTLRNRTPVRVIHAGSSAPVRTALIRRVGCPPANRIMTGAWYELNIRASEPILAFGVVRAASASDLDGDGRREVFLRCASAEGFHLTVWTGRQRRWHAYHYAGYDLQPDCTAEETQ